jgi:hypothetical protein
MQVVALVALVRLLQLAAHQLPMLVAVAVALMVHKAEQVVLEVQVAVVVVLLETLTAHLELVVLLEQLIEVVAVEAVVLTVLVGHILDLLVVQEQSLFPTQVPSVALAALLQHLVVIQSTRLHHLAHIRLNHAKHDQCTARKRHNLHIVN